MMKEGGGKSSYNNTPIVILDNLLTWFFLSDGLYICLHIGKYTNNHWRQKDRKSGGAEWEFETYLVKFETYSVLQDYETKKTTGAPAPAPCTH